MKFMEIERKFTIRELPPQLEQYPCLIMEQAYLNADPVVRIRKENDTYYLTYKGKGLLAREEYNLPLNRQSYEHLLNKADGIVISKKRYCIPYNDFLIELDLFDPPLAPLILAEVEFSTLQEAQEFVPPEWFLLDVTEDKKYHNSNMALNTKIKEFGHS